MKTGVVESDEIKKNVGIHAAHYIKDGMIVGLGSGSTVKYTLHELGKMVSQGLQLFGVSTSVETQELAHQYKIPLLQIEDVKQIDMTIDGADQVDSNGNGIKGKHGFFLKEKMVANISKKNIWVITESKLTDVLGKIPVPVEVLKESHEMLRDMFKLKKIRSEIRVDQITEEPLLSENGNYLIDLYLNRIEDPFELENFLQSLPGLVETGLFLNIADTVLVGKYNYEIEICDYQRK